MDYLKKNVKSLVIIPILIIPILLLSYNPIRSSEVVRRIAIENKFPQFTSDFEKQECFAGCTVKSVKHDNSYYYAFITYGSGIPIGSATCIQVDESLKVSRIGDFIQEDTLIAEDINPINCKGVN